jgi:hypothetical protein
MMRKRDINQKKRQKDSLYVVAMLQRSTKSTNPLLWQWRNDGRKLA